MCFTHIHKRKFETDQIKSPLIKTKNGKIYGKSRKVLQVMPLFWYVSAFVLLQDAVIFIFVLFLFSNWNCCSLCCGIRVANVKTQNRTFSRLLCNMSKEKWWHKWILLFVWTMQRLVHIVVVKLFQLYNTNVDMP